MPIFWKFIANLSPNQFLFFKFRFFSSAGNVIQQIKNVSPLDCQIRGDEYSRTCFEPHVL